MAKRYLPIALPLAAMTVLTGCVDSKYDLSNIDSSVEVPVNDLVIPVNLGPVTLNSVIDLDDSETITKEDYTGNDPELQGKQIYVYNYHGAFDSKEIKINEFHVEAPGDLEPQDVHMELHNPANIRRRANGSIEEVRYKINEKSNGFSYNIQNIDSEVLSVDEVTTPENAEINFALKLQLPDDIKAVTEETELDNVEITFPKGLYMELNDGNGEKTESAETSIGSYDPETGVVNISDYVSHNGEINLTLKGRIIDMAVAQIELKDGKFNYDGDIVVKSGDIVLKPKPGISSFPDNFEMRVDYHLGDFNIEDFTGMIDYKIENLAFDDAMLDDMPDFLSQDETRIKLANPQLYMSIVNTCSPYHLTGVTGLDITPYRNDEPGTTLHMDQDIRVGYNRGNGPYLFAISPEGEELTPIADYNHPYTKKLSFTSLGDVLYGNGLPQKIQIEFPDPHVDGTALQFPIGQMIPAINGSYIFRAPLALADGSQIVYSGTRDDWGSEELNDLYVKYLELNADITSEVPLAIKFSAQLVNEAGDKMGVCEPIDVPAGAKNLPIVLKITPEAGQEYIHDIDGIFYKAWAVSNSEEANPLSPEQHLTLDNVRIKVSGKYLHIDDNK